LLSLLTNKVVYIIQLTPILFTAYSLIVIICVRFHEFRAIRLYKAIIQSIYLKRTRSTLLCNLICVSTLFGFQPVAKKACFEFDVI